jgi:tetratricopeptide (TPR) repeat protein
VGCERGVPFYAMQFIEGRSLAQLIAELRRLEGLDAVETPAADLAHMSTSALAANLVSRRLAPLEPGGRMEEARTSEDLQNSERISEVPERGTPSSRTTSHESTRTRAYVRTVAQFGVQVAEALDHAHTRGILHRDIKPGNLLLDDQGQLWVTDFGLAQIQGNPGLTLTGDILGTLRYMSPEQALGKRVVIDGRTDIYSLGLTLHELLTLRPAIDGQDRQEILRSIADEEPAPIRKFNPAVPRDLETTLLKAMAKEPSGRYATAKELADELRRFLEDKPIMARRPSWLDRAAKWGRRHRPLVASTAVATVLFLILAVVVLASSNLRIQKEQQRADEERGRADANLLTARAVVNRMFTRVAQDLEHIPRMEKMRRALLEDALGFYRGFLQVKSSDPVVRSETARAYMRVAQIDEILGRFPEAVEPWHQAEALLEDLAQEFPAIPDYRRDLAFCHRELCYVMGQLGQPDDCLERRRTEFRIRERLAAEFPGVPDYRRELARCHTELALQLEETDRKEAEDHLRKALPIWEALRKDFPAIPGDLYGHANSHHWLGSILMNAGRLPDAERELREALALAEQSLAAEPDRDEFRYRVVHIKQYLAIALRKLGKLAESEQQLRQSIPLGEKLVEDFSDTPDCRRRLALTYFGLSDTLRDMGRLREAEDVLRRGLSEQEKFFSASPHGSGASRSISRGWAYYQLGLVIHAQATGRVQEAAEAFRQAKDRLEQATESPRAPFALRHLADFLANCPATPFRDLDRAITLAKEASQSDPHARDNWNLLGKVEYRAGHWDDAIEAWGKWLELGDRHDPWVGFMLAMAHWRLSQKNEARQWYDQAVGWMDQRKSRDEELRRLRAEAAALLGLPCPRRRPGRRCHVPPSVENQRLP